MSTISASTTNTTAYKVTADTTGALVLQTGSGPTTAVTIDTSQNVGIGTSSPVTKLTMAGNIAFSGDQSLTWNTYSNAGDKYIANGYAAQFYYNPSAGTLRYLNAGNNVSGAGAAASLTDRFAIDTSGNVGIGTSSPSCRLDVQNATQKTSLTGTSFGVLNLKSTTATGDYAALTFSSSAGVPGAVMAYQQTASGGQIAFGISNNYGSGITSEAARFDSSGRLLVGTTTSPSNTGGVIVANNELFIYNIPTTASGANCNISSGESNRFYRSTSALKYKQDIRDIELIDISKFRPVRYKSKCENDDQTKDHFGIIADEVHEAGITELVSYGIDGEIEGFQYDRLTVVLLKTIQEQQATIQTLTARIEALEAK